jgi:hypothetical protein
MAAASLSWDTWGAGEGAGKVMRVNSVDGPFHAVALTAEFLNPADVTIDQSGNVWVADFDISGGDSRLHRIRIDRLTGRQTTLSSGGMCARPLAITVAR